MMTRTEIIKEIELIASDPKFINIIVRFVINDFCGTREELKIAHSPKDYLNYNEAAFLIGLWLKNYNQQNKYFIDINGTTGKLYELMDKLHRTFLDDWQPNLSLKETPAEALAKGSNFQEAFFYSSTGGYDVQYIKMANNKYKFDNDWIKENKKFSISSTEGFFNNIRNLINKKLNIFIQNHELYSEDEIINIFCFTRAEIISNDPEWHFILKSFFIDPRKENNISLNMLGDFNEFYITPIIYIGNDTYFIPIPFYIAEAIYESPFYWMNKDKSYSAIALKNRGFAGENIVYNILTKKFGKNKVFIGL